MLFSKPSKGSAVKWIGAHASHVLHSVGIQALICFNGYMAQYLEHEKQAIAAEEQVGAPITPMHACCAPCFDAVCARAL